MLGLVDAVMELYDRGCDLTHKLLCSLFSALSSFPRDLIYDVTVFCDKFTNFFAEVVATERAFRLHNEPVWATCFVEVVLWVAGKYNQVIIFDESD